MTNRPDFLFSKSARDYTANVDGITFPTVGYVFRNTTDDGEYLWTDSKDQSLVWRRQHGGIVERFVTADIP